ncbi:head maturation protease, ClpP-related [Chachezhania sediminis]|uniref:head maturation protease, ClpP-related n=1 Tax=Chachezhania sediminis TaxID=2599291 RepID=UPI00131BD41F|nr:head maturation protease, ClpP-related [Chachezhania sediminis]
MNEIFLTGTVGFSFWDEDSFTARSVREQLEGLTGPLTVRLNSGGGIATEGQAIYTVLKNYDGEVTVVIDGIAASAASLVAMAGDRIVMPVGALMMIHDPALCWTVGRGTEQDHLDAAKGLGVCANAYAAVYAARSGMSLDAAREIMRAETYYDGPAAVEAGFATDTDDGAEAAAAALFDYRLYAKAPAALRATSTGLASGYSRNALVALMSGATTKQPQKGISMPKTIQMQAEEEQEILDAEAEAETETDPEMEDDATSEDPEEAAGEDDLGEEDPEDAPEAEASDDNPHAGAILRFAASRRIGTDIAMDWIGRGLTAAQAIAEFKSKHGNDTMTKARPGMTRAQIQRDERDTRRLGMSQALTAQITGSDPVSGAARPFMDMSIVEIAAASIDHRGRIRSTGDKLNVFTAASHATSDFPAIFQNALNKVLLERYSAFQPTYRTVAKKKNFRDFRPMPLVRAGDFPTLLPVGEGGEIKWGTFGESGETALIVPYARGLTVSRQMMINDDLGAINDLLSSYGETVAFFEEKTFYAGALTAKLADDVDLFHADHGNLAGAGTAITTAALSAGRTAMRQQKSIDGLSLNLAPTTLLVGPAKETEAEMIVAQITPTDATAVNPFSGRLRPVVTTEITGNAWYLLSDRAPCWVYGFLDGAEAPRVRTEEPFGAQGFAMTVEHDFGFGACDFRGGYKNAGA